MITSFVIGASYTRYDYWTIDPPPLAKMMGVEATNDHLSLDVAAEA